jgi:hypothetical protein
VQSIAPALPQVSAAESGAAAAVKPEAEAQPSPDAARVEEERKRAEAQTQAAKANKEKQAAEKAAAVPEAVAGVPRATTTPPVQPTPVAQEACVGVKVWSRRGDFMPGARIVLTEISNSARERVFNGRTGPAGRMVKCGLRAGNRVHLEVFVQTMAGMSETLRTTREGVLTPGNNYFDIQFGERPDRRDPDRRRPRRMRP